jgi:hypothetical protein
MTVSSVKTGYDGISLLAGNAAYFPSSYESIATVTVGSGGSATVDFTSIPATYTHLQVRFIARSNRSDNEDILFTRYNNDTGTNYAYHWLAGQGSAVETYAGSSTASVWTGSLSGVNAASTTLGAGIIDVFDYTNTNKNTTTRILSGYDANGNGRIVLSSTLWNNTTAVNRITLLPGFGTLFTQYSSFALYGIRGA